MAEALVSSVVEQLVSIMVRELEQEVRLVVGVKKEVEKLTGNLTAIQAVIADAETKQVKEVTVRDWLEKLKDVAYDIGDVLDDWEAAILSSQNKPGDEQEPEPRWKVSSFLRSPCFCWKQVGLRHDIANKIKELKERLDDIAEEKARYHFVPKEGNPITEQPRTISMIDIKDVKGREEEKSELINKLLSDGNKVDLRVLSMVGMGGIGKTTLAQFAFNDDRIKKYFNERIWVCVSDSFDETRVAKAILESLLKSTPKVTELESLLQNIRETIQRTKFLLILDDVWEENPDKWHRLKQSLSCGLSGSKVLVTTRKENVASVMDCFKDDILKIRILSDEECWLIVSKIALFDRGIEECKRLEEIGKNLSRRCRGLPLAAKVLGGYLRIRKSRKEWESVLKSEIWELEEFQRDIFPALWLSYLDLSPALKQCFSYCAIFPKDYEIERKQLIELWMAQGFLKQKQSDDLEGIGEQYFQNLAMRSFFQDFLKETVDDHTIYSCKMHDIVHDFVHIIARNECHSVWHNGPMESIMGSVSQNVRHLGLMLPKHELSLDTFKGIRKMRSLLFLQFGRGTRFAARSESFFGRPDGSIWLSRKTTGLSSFFSELTHARSLGLKECDYAEIPSSISNLVHLRYLDLSYNRNLKKLPETLCELHNLQTIDVSSCSDYLQLPLGIRKLIKLRHLHNYEGPGRLPKGIAQITGLKTLEVVDVGCDGNAFSLGDLKNLNQLQGRLHIKNLGAHNHRACEAKEAELKKKQDITQLQLHFKSREDEEGKKELDHLLEALEPSPNLEILEISSYKGTALPGWMINSLTNLRHIKLSDCPQCSHLPSLGKLPSLETLVLDRMWSVKKVGVELLGIETPPQIGGDRKSQIISASSSSSSSSSSSPVVVVAAFPKLTKLVFNYMTSWEEWDDYNYNNDGTAKSPSIAIMPSLRTLKIHYCPDLKALPNYILQNTMLLTLVVDQSDLLAKRYKKEKGEDWSKISPNIDVRIF